MSRPIVGLVPAAGQATRWRGQLDSSKELYPIHVPGAPGMAPVISYLLDAYALAGLGRTIVVTRSTKLDIPATLRDGKDFGCPLAYVIVDQSPSVLHSIVATTPFLESCDVVLGYPDIVFEPKDAMKTMIDAWSRIDCDVLLSLFETDHPETADTVQVEPGGRIRRVAVKQPTGWPQVWMSAIWTPRFTAFLGEWLSRHVDHTEDLHVGHVIQSAIDDGLVVHGLHIPQGRYLDIGTPERAGQLPDFWSST